MNIALSTAQFPLFAEKSIQKDTWPELWEVFPTENIEDLGYHLTFVICQVTLQFKLLYELTNHVTDCYYDCHGLGK